MVDGGASLRIFNAYGVDIQDVGTSTVIGSCGHAARAPKSRVPPPQVVERVLDRAITDRTHGSISLTGAGCEWPAPCYPGFSCVDRKHTRSSLLPGSDGAGEFRKDCCEPVDKSTVHHLAVSAAKRVPARGVVSASGSLTGAGFG